MCGVSLFSFPIFPNNNIHAFELNSCLSYYDCLTIGVSVAQQDSYLQLQPILHGIAVRTHSVILHYYCT